MQYHQYAPIGHQSNNLAPYQRTVHDLFIPNDLREEIQKKLAATLQTLPSMYLEAHLYEALQTNLFQTRSCRIILKVIIL